MKTVSFTLLLAAAAACGMFIGQVLGWLGVALTGLSLCLVVKENKNVHVKG